MRGDKAALKADAKQDVPVACVSSGAVLTLEAVVGGVPGGLQLALSALDKFGVEARFTGSPCPACRFTSSAARRLEKAATCEYRPLRGPLFVPR